MTISPIKRLAIGILLLASALGTPSTGLAKISKLPPDVRAALIEPAPPRTIARVKNLPPGIVAFCADNHGRMAEAGQNWHVTETVLNDTLAFKRLIWAVTKNNFYVVHYKSGGIAHGYHILVATIDKGRTVLVWHAIGNGPLNNFNDFKNAPTSDPLDDERSYHR